MLVDCPVCKTQLDLAGIDKFDEFQCTNCDTFFAVSISGYVIRWYSRIHTQSRPR